MSKRDRIFRIACAVVIGASLAGCSYFRSEPGARSPGNPSTPEDRKIYFAVIQGLYAAGQSQAALAYLDDFDKRYPGSLDSKILRGHASIAIGQYQEATAIFREVIHAGAIRAGHEGLGKISAKRRDWVNAYEHFAVAINADPANAKLLNNLGYALLMNGRLEDAWSVLARAAELRPKDKQIRNNLLLAEYWGNGRARAIAALEAIDDDAERDAVWRFISRWKDARANSSG